MSKFIYNPQKMGNPAYQAFFYCKKRNGEWENTNKKDSIFCVDAVLSKEERHEIILTLLSFKMKRNYILEIQVYLTKGIKV